MDPMEADDSPYVFREERDEDAPEATADRNEQDTVIVDGRAMSYRAYRSERGRDREA